MGDVVQEAAFRLQGGNSEGDVALSLKKLTAIAGYYSLALTGDDLEAFSRLVQLREANSRFEVIPGLSSLKEDELRAIGAPLELCPSRGPRRGSL